MPSETVAPTPAACQYPDPIPGVIPFGSLNFFAGASGVGKTILLADWCARWRDGRTICGHKTNRPTGFYYLAADRDWSTYAAAFKAAGFADIPHYTLAEDYSLNPREWKAAGALKLFEDCLNKLAPIPGSIVFVDPVAPLFIEGDQNRARDVAVSLHWFRRCGVQRAVSMFCLANMGKAKAEVEYLRPQDRIAGSGAFVAFSDTQLYLLGEEEPERHVLFGWTPRRHEEQTFRFQFDTTTELFVPYRGTTRPTTKTVKTQALQLLALIPTDGIETTDLEELAIVTFDVVHSTVYRWLKSLTEEQRIERDAFGRIQRRKVS